MKADSKDPLDGPDFFSVQQHRETFEIVTGIEQRNRFTVTDDQGRPVLFGSEHGSRLLRILLGAHRPYTLWFERTDGSTYIGVESPFRLFFFTLTVCDANGATLGRVLRRFSLAHPTYTVFDAHGIEVFTIRRFLTEIWTYRILRNGRQVGLIKKKWGGALKETFSDADTFRLDVSSVRTALHRQLLLGALALIDKDKFEGNSSSVVGAVTAD